MALKEKEHWLLFVFTTLIAFFSFDKVYASDFSVAEINNLLNKHKISKRHTSIDIIDLDNDKSLYSLNHQKPMTPASNLKIVTSAAAIDLLKPEYRFRTNILVDKIEKGIVQGDIYLTSNGNPSLKTKDLWEIVREIKFRGIKQITGDLIVDNSYFDNKTIGEGWNVSSYGSSYYSPRISSVSLNENVARVWVRPNYNENELAIVSVEPENSFFEINNRTNTTGKYNKYVINRNFINNKNIISVTGNVSKKSFPEFTKVNISKPSLYVGYTLKNILKKEGISFNGKVKVGSKSNYSYKLVSSFSPPLINIVYDFNKKSINLTGELLLKSLGAKFRKQPGTAKKGFEVIKKEFIEKKLKINDSNFYMADGSGLSPKNRVTTEILTNTLKYMHNSFAHKYDFIGSLATSGVDGTLKKRVRRNGKRLFRAKTGYISGTSSLSGYTNSENDVNIAFSIIINRAYDVTRAINFQNDLALYLAKVTIK